jgi:glucose 1-dehydrogenase
MSADQILRGKTAWVVGATGGIGSAIAEAMRDAGATVLATGSRAGDGIEECDISDPDAIEAFLDRAWEMTGGIDVLVNAAGIAFRKDVLDITVAEWDRRYAVNVRGPFLCSQGVARRLIAEGRPGSIVNIGSINAWVAHPETATYASTKGAMQTLTYALAVAWGPFGIRVNCIAPGTIPTGINKARFEEPGGSERAVANVPLGRLGTPEDVAPAAVFLASDASAYTTGAVLGIHGGKTLLA